MNNEVNIIITSLDALEKWTAVHHADVEEDRGIPDDALVGIRFAATPYWHSLCSRMEENPERQFRLRDELTKIGVPRSYLNVLDWELSRPRNEDGEIDFVKVATLGYFSEGPSTRRLGDPIGVVAITLPRLDMDTGEMADSGQIEPLLGVRPREHVGQAAPPCS